VDPFSLSWMARGCLYTVPAPGASDASTDLRCCWFRARNGTILGSVVEVAILDERRRVRYLDPASPNSLRFEFTVQPKKAGCRVEVAGLWNQPGFMPRSIGTPKWLVYWRAEQLQSAVLKAPEPVPDFPLYVLEGAREGRQEWASGIDISAPLDVIWAVVDDPDGSLLNSPEVVRQWRSITTDAELFFSVHRLESGGLGCAVSQVIRHADHHVTTKHPNAEVEYRLRPRLEGGELTMTHRWDPSDMASREAVAERADSWLSRVKAAAESLARRP